MTNPIAADPRKGHSHGDSSRPLAARELSTLPFVAVVNQAVWDRRSLGDRQSFDQMAAQDGNILGRGELLARLTQRDKTAAGHWVAQGGFMRTPIPKASRKDKDTLPLDSQPLVNTFTLPREFPPSIPDDAFEGGFGLARHVATAFCCTPCIALMVGLVPPDYLDAYKVCLLEEPAQSVSSVESHSTNGQVIIRNRTLPIWHRSRR